MTTDNQATSTRYQWTDDLLERGQYAQFLTGYINSKCPPDQRGMVMALDAPWGLGKTFFITHWAEELNKSKHHAIIFDAWKNDSAEDPVISFMAELRLGLMPFNEKLPHSDVIKEKINQAKVNLRKAILPVGKVLAKSAFKYLTKTSIEEVSDAIKDSTEGGEKITQNISKAAEVSQEALNAGLDLFFDQALEGQKERNRAIDDFQKSLEDLLGTMRNEGVIEGPLYVFIDELDRCRPDYAIRLLEGIKHLFNVKGVAFVVSTNIEQLSKAIGAVYGLHFDGRQYLKRFFDVEYDLPAPTPLKYIRLLLESTDLKNKTRQMGLDDRISDGDLSIENEISIIAENMQLDLRAIERAIRITDAAASSIPNTQHILIMWLFFLAAAKGKSSDEYKEISNESPRTSIGSNVEKIMPGKKSIVGLNSSPDSNGIHRMRVHAYDPLEILLEIHQISIQPLEHTIQKYQNNRDRSDSYEQHLRSQLIRWNGLNRSGKHPISQYPKLIAMAGHIVG